jgi:hypothetical protein
LWTKEEGELYVEQRKRLSAKLDPSLNLPSWCKAESEASVEATDAEKEDDTEDDN